MITSDRCEIWVSVNSQFYYEDGRIKGVEGTFHEITEQKDQEEIILSLAFKTP